MVAFAHHQRPADLKQRIENIDGSGAFSRFRDLVHTEGLRESWQRFSLDRQTGRARELLAREGVTVAARQ